MIDKYTGVWVDHKNAFIVSLLKDGTLPDRVDVTIDVAESNADRKVRLSGGSRARKTPYGPQEIAVDGKAEAKIQRQLKTYYQHIIKKVQDAKNIYIFGPGEAKKELVKEISKSREMAAKIGSVETADKMTRNQIAARVKRHYGYDA